MGVQAVRLRFRPDLAVGLSYVYQRPPIRNVPEILVLGPRFLAHSGAGNAPVLQGTIERLLVNDAAVADDFLEGTAPAR